MTYKLYSAAQNRQRRNEIIAMMLESGTRKWAFCPARFMATAMIEAVRNPNLDLEQVIDAGIRAFDSASWQPGNTCLDSMECDLVRQIISTILDVAETFDHLVAMESQDCKASIDDGKRIRG